MRFVPIARQILAMLVFGAVPLFAQSAEAPARGVSARRQGFSVNLAFIRGEAKGSISEGVEGGSGAGIAYERPVGARYSWRAEVAVGSVVSDVGLTSDGFFQYPSKLNLLRSSIGGGARRYSANGLFVGVGAALKLTYDCWVDQEDAGGFLGGASVDCDDMTTPPFEAVSPSPSLALAAGLQSGRWEFELRFDQTFGTSARSESRTGSAYSLGANLHYRFGKRANALR